MLSPKEQNIESIIADVCDKTRGNGILVAMVYGP
jgi:hypothetical protein